MSGGPVDMQNMEKRAQEGGTVRGQTLSSIGLVGSYFLPPYMLTAAVR